MTHLTKEDLSNAAHGDWVEWLFGALLAYTANVPVDRRIRAFAPLRVDPNAMSPAGEIVTELERLPGQPLAAAGKAAIEVVRTWSPNIEPALGGELALQLATRLGGRNLFDATRTLLSKSINIPRPDRESLAFLAVKAAETRFRRSEVEQLARLLWKMDLLPPTLLADLTLLIAREDFNGLESLPETLLTLAPGIVAPPHDGTYADAIVKRILQAYPIEEVELALSPKNGDSDDVIKVRAICAARAVPWTREQKNRRVGADDLNAADRDELLHKTLSALGDALPDEVVVPFKKKT